MKSKIEKAVSKGYKVMFGKVYYPTVNEFGGVVRLTFVSNIDEFDPDKAVKLN